MKINLKDDLVVFRIYEVFIASFCIVIPLILKLADRDIEYPKKVAVNFTDKLPVAIDKLFFLNDISRDALGFRLSISDYVYSSNSYLFGMLFSIAAMLFLFNSAVYFRNEKSLFLASKGKWYNAILGLSLFGVVLAPHRDYVILHYIFACIFFVGNAVVMGLVHNKENKTFRISMAALTIIFMMLSVVFKIITILWAEWLSLTVIAVHFILETRAAAKRGIVMPSKN